MKAKILILLVIFVVSFLNFNCKKSNNTQSQADTTATVQKNVQLTLFDTIVKQQFADWKGYDYYDWHDTANKETKQGLEILQSIDSLDFSYKNLSTFPEQIFKCKNLKFLNLSDNKITTIPPQIADLKKLQNLDLSYNQIADLPAEFYNLTYVKTIDLEYNNFPRDQQIQIHRKMPNTTFDPKLSEFMINQFECSIVGEYAAVKIYDSLPIPDFLNKYHEEELENSGSYQDESRWFYPCNIMIENIDNKLVLYNFDDGKMKTIYNGDVYLINQLLKYGKIAFLENNQPIVLTLNNDKVINTEKFNVGDMEVFDMRLYKDRIVVYAEDEEDSLKFNLKKIKGYTNCDTSYVYFVSFDNQKIYKAKYITREPFVAKSCDCKLNRYFCDKNMIIDLKNKDTIKFDRKMRNNNDDDLDNEGLIWCSVSDDKSKLAYCFNDLNTDTFTFYIYTLPDLKFYKKLEIDDIATTVDAAYHHFVSIDFQGNNTIVYEDNSGNKKKITF